MPFYGAVLATKELAETGGTRPVPSELVTRANVPAFLARVLSLPMNCKCKPFLIANGERPYSELRGCGVRTCRVTAALNEVNPAADGCKWSQSFADLDIESRRCFSDAARLLGISGPDLDLQYDHMLLIHTGPEGSDQVMPAQAGHGDYLFGVQMCINLSPGPITSTVVYSGELPPLANYDPNSVRDVKCWLWETLQRTPAKLDGSGKSFTLLPGEALIFLGPIIHWAPKIPALTTRFMGFRTASMPGVQAHEPDKQMLAWSLAVEMEAVERAMDLAKAYTLRGLLPWTNWPSGSSMHKQVKDWVKKERDAYLRVMEASRDEQQATLAVDRRQPQR